MAALALVVVTAVVVLTSSGSPGPLGYDVSYPQCSSGEPSDPLFAIVGVNGGTAHTANPCLSGQIRWARSAPGQRLPHQPALSFYIDTGDPGSKSVSWPNSGDASVFGSCNGLLTNACSYLYGEQSAAYSFGLVSAIDSSASRSAPWWLDVEVLESWAGSYELNIAALRGFVAGLRSAGVTGAIGVYSTSEQWHEITGLSAQTTTQAFGVQLLDWVAGTGLTHAQAQGHCATGGFTGLTPRLAQYQRGRFDVNLRCG